MFLSKRIERISPAHVRLGEPIRRWVQMCLVTVTEGREVDHGTGEDVAVDYRPVCRMKGNVHHSAALRAR